jgi:hypothetical protein
MAESQLIYVYNSRPGTLTANPIVPNPKTATVDPGVTFAIFQADPIPENPKKRIHSQKETVSSGKITQQTSSLIVENGEKACTWQYINHSLPVATPHPRRQILSRGALGFTLAQQASSITLYWLKVEIPKKW